MIVKCICKHDAQDRIHGPGNRVANPTKDPERARCTICKTLIKIRRDNDTIKKGTDKK